MDPEQLAASPAGDLVEITGNDAGHGPYSHVAFVPHALGALPDLSATTWAAILAATSEVARLDQAARQIPNPSLLRRPTLRREAQSTSALEGTVVAFTDVLQAETDESASGSSSDIREVLNYVRAGEEAFDWIAERPITTGLLEGLQGTLMAGIDAVDPGRLRTRQVAIGTKGRPITEARFVPMPPGDALRSSLQDLVEWTSGAGNEVPIACAAMAHYQFETLHPFADGNGRIGRLLVVLQLMQSGMLRDPVLIVSPWFEARRRQYQDELLGVSQTGDWNSWVTFFARGIEAQALDTRERIERLLELQQEFRDLIDTSRMRGVSARIAEGLIEHPIVTATWAARRYGVSFQAANTALDRLLAAGLVTEMTGRRRDRAFGARKVIAALED